MSPEGWVLLVDDDEDIRVTLELVLGTLGHHVVSAGDGIEALEILRKPGPPPSVVLLDLMLPRLDGTEVLQRMKTDPRLRDIPVVIMSGDTEAREQALALHADGCLVKPVELSDLSSTLERYEGTSPQA